MKYFTEEEAKAFVARVQREYPSLSFLTCDDGIGEKTGNWIVGLWHAGYLILVVHNQQEWDRFVPVCHCIVHDGSVVSPSLA